MRSELVVPHREPRRRLYLQPRAVSVVPLRRWVNLERAWQFDLGGAPQRLPKHSGFDRELMSVVRVLKVASTTELKVRTAWLRPSCRRLGNRVQPRPRKACFVLGDLGFNGFVFEHKRNKHTLPRTLIISRKARQTIAPINKFFDLQLHKVDSSEAQGARAMANRFSLRLTATNAEHLTYRTNSVLEACIFRAASCACIVSAVARFVRQSFYPDRGRARGWLRQ